MSLAQLSSNFFLFAISGCRWFCLSVEIFVDTGSEPAAYVFVILLVSFVPVCIHVGRDTASIWRFYFFFCLYRWSLCFNPLLNSWESFLHKDSFVRVVQASDLVLVLRDRTQLDLS
ncbi:uncharacterized protein P174DRAFT_110929 [Aspergillus novofumigatus IBT 16806]|uniref:Uncharacterized protein n=1 Tax=Aspergillus novofumigatus (strain IBT 16806) TaxID=1392255 RepID=A0A2I1CIM0_ASPN1|nr:uncharacterized protein P174DRAFT_110929 [Aspergillus novofumigatus IBT 16806]PKX97473.1 hypothetical protein P174DRAFT_110929 [Aspergillus novofumigatus IBT 16806]